MSGTAYWNHFSSYLLCSLITPRSVDSYNTICDVVRKILLAVVLSYHAAKTNPKIEAGNDLVANAGLKP